MLPYQISRLILIPLLLSLCLLCFTYIVCELLIVIVGLLYCIALVAVGTYCSTYVSNERMLQRLIYRCDVTVKIPSEIAHFSYEGGMSSPCRETVNVATYDTLLPLWHHGVLTTCRHDMSDAMSYHL